ncbi:MAG: ABC transporter ATP-binding protein [Lachnospiraceae bacterium]|uniref:ABC transporter ATP-binding protein n=1 Tax=Candidatus Weimeria bifida TaxID=2599074 RepID=A0A6N7IY60_9FIRM|nr:ABC transporter ATP-binding protein [Candidatus Weimeria bifida]RRF97278.1 MAG: ABC transporter ATP-binding protein [Lachnospiraceae bacterium]
MILLSDVSKIYHIGDDTVKALDHAKMYVDKGEFVSVIGPSGSGKSTLMNIVGCLDTATSGQYFLDGQEVADYSRNELARIRNRKIGFIFQDFNLLQKLSAYENVELPLIYQGLSPSKRKEQVEDALNAIGLWDRRDHRPNELSGGQKQRVAIARALATHPSLFLADEPTGNLDQKTGGMLLDIFHRLNEEGNTILLITHDPNVAKEASRSVKILDGHVSEAKDMSEIEEVV